MRGLRSWIFTLAFSALLAAPSLAQQANDLPPGVTREQMWYAPTAKDWAQPTLIPWQRTWADAVELSKQSKKAILICVNMDGEIASEHWAGIRYREPEIAALFEQYVCVIASTFRHNTRDYDARGNRIPCPRFGAVTCGEHIWMEPMVYSKYLDDTRVSPRHVMVELDGSETYDLYYAYSITAVVETVQKGLAERTIQPEDPPRGDRSLAELVASPNAADRALVEQNYLSGDRQARQEILAAAKQLGGAAPVDLLRQAAFGFDGELSGAALDLLSASERDKAVGLIDDLLRGPLEPERRIALLAALEGLGEQVPVAKRLASVHRGLSGRSELLDLDAWRNGMANSKEASKTATPNELFEEAVRPENIAALSSSNARVRKVAEENFRLALQSAVDKVVAATMNGQSESEINWNHYARIAIASKYLGNDATEEAHRAVMSLPAGESSWNAYAVLSIFADGRRDSIRKAADANQPWPKDWLSETQSAFAVLLQHPFATDAEVARHYDFLIRLRAVPTASRALQDGLMRFPDSWMLHERFRLILASEKGVDGVEAGYKTWLRRADAPQYLKWYAAQASLFAAEQMRRENRLNDADAAYQRALDMFAEQRTDDPQTTDSSKTYEVLAYAGRARLALDFGDTAAAADFILTAFRHHPDSAASLDGLMVTPVGTAKKILVAAQDAGEEAIVKEIQSALEDLSNRDTGLLELPAFERPVNPR
ncbi:MAG: hypothetical protein O3A95_05135 [Planctomycetota bacterium]|nr:hypothetical protein [Planctomycetota bacterium]MDA1113668.1 hypothetical protein [Planctomycetota bacterium]